MESDTTSLNVQSVTGYKFAYSQKGENDPDYSDGYESDYVVSGSVIEAKNVDQDESAGISSFDLPSKGSGYYMIAHNSTCATDLGGGTVDTYSASKKAEFRQSGTDLAWFPAISLSAGATFRIRQHTFANNSTVDEYLDVQNDWAYDNYKDYASVSEGVCTISVSGVYDVYLKNANSGYQLYIAQFDAGSSGVESVQASIVEQGSIQTFQAGANDSASFRGKMPWQEPKRALDGDYYIVGNSSALGNWGETSDYALTNSNGHKLIVTLTTSNQFKIRKGNTWLGYHSGLSSLANNVDGNIQVKSNGDYVVGASSTNSDGVFITKVPRLVGYGDFESSEWSWSGGVDFVQSGTDFVLKDQQLKAGEAFKITNDSTWYGQGDLDSGSSIKPNKAVLSNALFTVSGSWSGGHSAARNGVYGSSKTYAGVSANTDNMTIYISTSSSEYAYNTTRLDVKTWLNGDHWYTGTKAAGTAGQTSAIYQITAPIQQLNNGFSIFRYDNGDYNECYFGSFDGGFSDNNLYVANTRYYDLTLTSAGKIKMANASYTVTLNTNGGTINAGNVTSYTYGTGATLPSNVTKTGYSFGGWFTNEACTQGQTTSISGSDHGNKTYYAKWTAVSSTVTFYRNHTNDDTTIHDTISETYAQKYTLPASDPSPVNSTYVFRGWWTDKSGGSQVTTDTTVSITAAQSLYAHWEQCYYVQFDANGGDGTTANAYAAKGSNVTLTTNGFSKIGYRFLGWSESSSATSATYTDGQTVSAYSSTNPGVRAALLYAVWEAKTYTVTFDKQDGTGGSNSVTATYGSAMPSATMPSRTGYAFAGYYTSTGGGGTQYYTAAGASTRSWNIDGSRTLYANWTANKYTITLSATDAGNAYSTHPTASATFGSGMPSITTLPTRTGYTFAGYWTTASGDGTKYYNTDGTSANNWNIAAATTLYARWTANVYTITLNNNSATSAGTAKIYEKYDTGYYKEAGCTNAYATSGDSAKITVPTKTGYRFDGYYTDNGVWSNQILTSTGHLAANNLASTFSANGTLYAKWIANTYTVKFYKNNSYATGEAMADEGFTYGTPKALTSNTYSLNNYTFLGWSTSDSATTATYTNGQSVSTLTSTHEGTVDLYAVWQMNDGYYIHGAGISGDNVTFSGAGVWDFPLAIKSDTTPTDSNHASWTTVDVYLNTNAAFKIVHVVDHEIDEETGWFNTIPTDKTNPGFISKQGSGNYNLILANNAYAGAYKVYLNGSDVAYFYRKVTITLNANGGTAGTYTSVTVTSGEAIRNLTSDYIPTRSGYVFGGFWDASSNPSTRYIQADGTSTGTTAAWSTGTKDTVYARWYDEDDLFYTGETYVLVPGSWKDGGSYDYYINLCNYPSESVWVKMSSVSGAYTATLPTGYWSTLIFVRFAQNATPNWDTAHKQTADLSVSDALSNAVRRHSYQVTSTDATSTGAFLQEFTTGEVVYFDPGNNTSNWHDDNNAFGAYLFGGSAATWVNVTTRVDATQTYFSMTVPTGTWAGIIFVSYSSSSYRVESNTDSTNWSSKLAQTADLFRLNLNSTFKCFRFTTAPAGEWVQLTDRANGWYLVGTSSTSTSVLYPVNWKLNGSQSSSYTGSEASASAYNVYTDIAIVGPAEDSDLAKWGTVVLYEGDEFKIVNANNSIPYWKGYSDANFRLGAFFENNGGNIRVKRDCTVVIAVNSSSQIWINVKSFDSMATKTSYRDSSTDSGVTGSLAVTVNVNPENAQITSITGGSDVTNYTFLYISLSSAKAQSNPVGTTVNTLAGPTLYAIYDKQHFTLCVTSYIFADGSTSSGSATSNVVNWVYYLGEDEGFEGFGGVDPYGIVSYHHWYLYLQDNATYLYSAASCQSGSRVTNPYTANYDVAGSTTNLYARLVKQTNRTYYFKDNLDTENSSYPIVTHTSTFHGNIYVYAWYGSANSGGLKSIRLIHIYDNYYYCELPECASAVFSDGTASTGYYKSMDIDLDGADSSSTAKGDNDMVVVWKSSDTLDASGGRKFSWGTYPGQVKYWLNIGGEHYEMGEGNMQASGNDAVYEQPIAVSADDTFTIVHGIAYNSGTTLNVPGNALITASGDNLVFANAGTYTFYVAHDDQKIYVAMVPLKGEGYYLAPGVYANSTYTYTYANAVKMHTIDSEGATNLAQYYTYQVTASDITNHRNTVKPMGYVAGVELPFETVSVEAGSTSYANATDGVYTITAPGIYNFFVYKSGFDYCCSLASAGSIGDFFKLNSIDGSKANVKDQNTSFVLAIEFTANNAKAMDAYLDVTLGSTTSAYKFAATVVAQSALSSTDPYAYMRNYAYTSNPSAFTTAGSSNASFKIGTTTIAANSSNVFVAMLIIDYASVSGGSTLATLISSVRIGISQQA